MGFVTLCLRVRSRVVFTYIERGSYSRPVISNAKKELRSLLPSRGGSVTLGNEIADALHHVSLLVDGQAGKDRQIQDFICRFFRFRQTAETVVQAGETLLLVQRERVVDLRTNTTF